MSLPQWAPCLPLSRPVSATADPCVSAFFLPAACGQRFCLLRRPPDGVPVRAALVYIHPFAEEMNCARATVARQARALAAAGYAVLQIDLHGCGDSSGDFADALWADWQADVHLACDVLRQQIDAPLWLWGLRAGALLAAQVAEVRADAPDLLLWQPAWSGAQILRQMLRLKLAGEMLSGQAGGSVQALRQHLLAGTALEVGGYCISPQLAAGLDTAAWPQALSPRRIVCFELGSASELSPAFVNQRDAWQDSGHRVQLDVLAEPAFWQTPGVSVTAALSAATLAALAAEEA